MASLAVTTAHEFMYLHSPTLLGSGHPAEEEEESPLVGAFLTLYETSRLATPEGRRAAVVRLDCPAWLDDRLARCSSKRRQNSGRDDSITVRKEFHASKLRNSSPTTKFLLY